MNIGSVDKGFTTLVRIGIYSNFIHTKKDGFFMSVDELFDQCQHFNNIVIMGDEPLLQKDEIGRLFKRLVKNNNNIRLELHTNGVYKPSDLGGFKDNVVFYVYIALRNVGLKWEERINENNLAWYGELNTNFIFKVKDLDDVEEVTTLVSSLGLRKSQVFLIPIDNIEKIKEHIKFYGYNIALETEW
jgi:hypothetical protein